MRRMFVRAVAFIRLVIALSSIGSCSHSTTQCGARAMMAISSGVSQR